MVNIFIDLPALHRLREFGTSYLGMVTAQQHRNAQAAWEHQQQLAKQSLAVQRDFQRVGLGQVTLRDAPLLGGRGHLTAITTVMAYPDIAKEYNMHPQMILTNFQMAIGEYERRVRRGVLALFCPVWWLELGLRFLFRLPLGLFRIAGYNTGPFERSGPGKALQFVWSTVIVVLTLTLAGVSAAAGMQQVGWWEPFLQQLSSLHP